MCVVSLAVAELFRLAQPPRTKAAPIIAQRRKALFILLLVCCLAAGRKLAFHPPPIRNLPKSKPVLPICEGLSRRPRQTYSITLTKVERISDSTNVAGESFKHTSHDYAIDCEFLHSLR